MPAGMSYSRLEAVIAHSQTGGNRPVFSIR